ncbi:putative diphthamide synthesis protein-domain-containing protein [Baffinella frigidus]|nr:putative diphthamide synthesis protein-domain-containing protein [Cryptophyta sp. CCMP2293]
MAGKFKKFKITEKFESCAFSEWESKKLPCNINFEIKKTIQRLCVKKIQKVLLQFPEGFHNFYGFLFNIINFCNIFGRKYYISNLVTYGACCIEDSMGKYTGFEILIHYGHSCLIPISECFISLIYVFLEIKFDYSFLVESLKSYFFCYKNSISIFSTVQFISSLKNIKKDLLSFFEILIFKKNKPLSPGEILGCTSFKQKNFHNTLYIGDGRFHLESIVISNFNGRFLQFNPYSKALSLVGYKYFQIFNEREKNINYSVKNIKNFGFIIGSLGRQGGDKICKRLSELGKRTKLNFITATLGEINSDKIETIGRQSIDAWVQIACPRLSIDWGFSFRKPILTPFELSIVLGLTTWNKLVYPMDFYSNKSGYWSNYAKLNSSYKFYLNNIDYKIKSNKHIFKIHERK